MPLKIKNLTVMVRAHLSREEDNKNEIYGI